MYYFPPKCIVFHLYEVPLLLPSVLVTFLALRDFHTFLMPFSLLLCASGQERASSSSAKIVKGSGLNQVLTGSSIYLSDVSAADMSLQRKETRSTGGGHTHFFSHYADLEKKNLLKGHSKETSFVKMPRLLHMNLYFPNKFTHTHTSCETSQGMSTSHGHVFFFPLSSLHPHSPNHFPLTDDKQEREQDKHLSSRSGHKLPFVGV